MAVRWLIDFLRPYPFRGQARLVNWFMPAAAMELDVADTIPPLLVLRR